MRKYKYLLFDWDGCLAQTLQIWLGAYKEVFAKFSLYPKEKEITEKVFGDWTGATKLGIKNMDLFTKETLKIVNKKLPNVALYEYAEEALISFKTKGKKLALLTTSKRSSIHPALKNRKLIDFFDTILTDEDVDKHKPHPEIIEKALSRLKGQKERAVIIGDSAHDLGAAKNAGIDSILFYPDNHKIFYDFEFLKKQDPTYTISHFRELASLIK